MSPKKVLQPEAFPLPKKLSQVDFLWICQSRGIPDGHVAWTRRALDEAVEVAANMFSQTPKKGDRRKDRGRLTKARSHIDLARRELHGLEIQGLAALKSTAKPLGDVLSSGWLNRQLFKSAIKFMRPDEPAARYFLIERRAPQTLRALLQAVDSGLASALKALNSSPRGRGGRRRLENRHHMILNLALVWHSIRKKVSGSTDSEFAIFCEAVFAGIGWPIQGLSDALPDAIKDWRDRSKEDARLGK
jgi:hypothetical protein